MTTNGCRRCLYLLISFCVFLTLYSSAIAQPTTCFLDFQPGGSPAAIDIYAPWLTNGRIGNTNAANDPAYAIDIVTNGNPTVPNGTYLGWCIDYENDLAGTPTVYSTLLFSSCDTNLDAELHALGLGYPGSVYVDPQVWNQINYLLNHKNGAYFFDVQIALWVLIGGPSPDTLSNILAGEPPPTVLPYHTNVINALLSAATNNAAGWQPECGNVVGAIVAELNTNEYDPVQLTMIEVPYPCVPCLGVTKQVACWQPTNNCTEFGKTARGLAGIGCSGIDQPAFCYQISVTNCGSVPLTNLVVSDNLMGLLSSSFVSNQLQVLQPGGGATAYFTMSFSTNATNTVTVSADAALANNVTNLGTNYLPLVVSNGLPLTASDSAVALVDTASVSCTVTLYSPLDLDGNLYDNNVTLPAAAFYSSPPVVTLGVHVVNSGTSALAGVTISAPALAGFNCAMPPAFNLPPGGSQDFQLCLGLVSCPASLAFNLNVNGVVVQDTNYCAVYDLNGTNLIAVCSSCTGHISCSTNCSTANVSGAVLLQCSATNVTLAGDSGLSGIPVSLYGASNNLLATVNTDPNGNYTFTSLAAGSYYVAVTMPTNYVETYPAGTTNGVLAVTVSPCTNVNNLDFGYAAVAPPVISVVPGTYLGCNPTNLPTTASVGAQVTATTSCGPATNVVTSVDSTNGCVYTRTFTITVSDTYGNSATTNVVYTWTSDTAPPVLNGVPVGTNLGCNPASVPTAASVQAIVTASDTCSPATINVTEADSTNGCSVAQIFTITATNACGNMATAYVTNTWTANTTPPVITGVPVGQYLGCNPANIPTTGSVQAIVFATATCGTPTVNVVETDITNGCALTQIFAVTAVDSCGNTSKAFITNTWTAFDAAPVLANLPNGSNFGCNPASVPTAVALKAAISIVGQTPSSNLLVNANFATGDFTGWTVTKTGSGAPGLGGYYGVTNGSDGGIPVPLAGDTYGAYVNPSADVADLSQTVNIPSTGIATITAWVEPVFNDVDTFQISVGGVPVYVTNFFDEGPYTEISVTVPVVAGPTVVDFQFAPGSGPMFFDSASVTATPAVCSAATLTVTESDTTNGCGVTQVFTVLATNTCGGKTSDSITNTWTVNTTPPTINNLPIGMDYGCNPTNAPTPASVQAQVSASDTCSSASILVTESDSTNGCQVMQILTVTASDACSNTAVAYVTNTWTANTTAPILYGLPDSMDLGCNPAYIPTVDDLYNDVSAYDPCDDNLNGSIIVNFTTNNCDVTELFTVTVYDFCNNTTVAYVTNTFTIDTQPPVLVGVPANTNLGCNPTNIPTAASVQALVSASDTCSPATVTVTESDSTNGCNVMQIFDILATNACQNQAEAFVTNTWTFNATPPALHGVPVGQNYGCNPSNLPTVATIQGEVSVTGTCSAATANVTAATTTNGCNLTEIFTITANDACGNTATAYVTNTWTVDTQPPTLNGVPPSKYFGCNPASVPSAADIQAVVSASDACSPATVTVTGSPISTNGCLLTEIFTVTATNACGNMAQAYVTNTWTVDTAPPVLNGVPASQYFGCNPATLPTAAAIQGAVTASDTCSPATVTVTAAPIATNGCLLTEIFTIIATNACGNMASASVTNTWTVDTAPPVLNGVPSSKYYGCNPTNLPTTATIQGSVSASDTCSPATVAVTAAPITTNGCLLTEIFTITATNACGNMATASVTNTWTVDTAPPVLNGVPSSQYFGCNPANLPTAASIQGSVSASDTCSPATVVVTAAPITTNGCLLTEIFTITATNACGNMATASVTNTWTVDTAPPVLNGVPSSQYFGCNPANLPTAASIQGSVSASDTCSPATVVVTAAPITTNGCLLTEIFTITATNACGNMATASVTNTWTVDTAPPVLNGVPSSQYFGCNPATLPTAASIQGSVSASDTCSPATVVVTAAPITTNGCLLTEIFTITATNACGNMATASVTNTWTVDTAPPVLNGVPSSHYYGCNPTNLPTSATIQGSVSASDTCSPATVAVTAAPITTNGCLLTEIFTITATNACGNMATASVTNTWTVDTAPPVLNGVPVSKYYGYNPTNLPTASTIQSMVSASDTCSPATVTVTAGSVLSNGCQYSEIFTIMATNACGNLATAYVTNTWSVETTPPMLLGVPPGAYYGCNPTNLPTAASIKSQLLVTDVCSQANLNASVSAGNITSNGCLLTEIFTVTATNAGGNIATAYVTNTWTADTTPPMLNGVPSSKYYGYNPTNLPTAASIQAMVSASDTCSPATVIVTPGSISSNGCQYSQIFVITATNACGNMAKAYVTNTWSAETTPPTLNGVPSGKNYGCNPTNLPTVGSIQSTVTASDSCGTPAVSVTASTVTNGCTMTEIFTITATNAGGNAATAYVTNTWTSDTTPPVLNGVPAGVNYGCNPVTVPTVAGVQAAVTATDACSAAPVVVTCATATNGCAVTQIFSISATDNCGNTANAYVTNTWNLDTNAPVFSGIPAGKNLGCNPTNIPTVASVQAAVSATDSCSTPVVSVTAAMNTNGCAITQVFTIVATNACGTMSTAYVTNTWTSDASAPVLSGVPAGKSYGCNPTNIPTAASVQALVTASDTCSPATVHVTAATTTNGCAITQILTVIATNACGNMATAYVTNTWSADAAPPVLSGVPAGVNFGCNPTNIPTAASVQALVSATDTCSPATVHVTGTISTNGCSAVQVFTIVATNSCGNMATAYVTNTWAALPLLYVTNASYLTNVSIVTNYYLVTNYTYTTNKTVVTNITVTTNCCTNAICGNFNASNPGTNNWLWCNAHLSSAPGSNCTLTCSNASITLSCLDNKVYSFPISNCVVNFSSGCTTATNWFDGTTWHTTLPCSGDDEIFLQGCAIPWQSDFAGCQSVCWTATFCGTPALNCNWQWGAACYSGSAPSCGSIAPKACHNVSCQNGQYYTSSDHAGCPENYKPGCVGGGTGGGGANCTGSWSGTGTTCGFGLHTNTTVTTNIVITTNAVVGTNSSTSPVTTVTTNYTVTTTTAGPVLSGVPIGAYLGCNPTNIPTIAAVQAEVTASATCSAAPVYVTIVASTNGCLVTQLITISATNACGNSTVAYVTNTWTADKNPPVLNGVPAGGYAGCNSNTVPTDATLLAEITATDPCSSPTITVTHQDSGSTCLVSRVFTITAVDACGNTTVTNVTYTWTAHTPDYCTNVLCGGFNSQNPGTNAWLWCNAHVSGSPGSNCTLYCQNASVTFHCNNGQTYSYAIPNGTINFSSGCTTGTNWFDGTNWNTTLPCSGDDEIFLQGCAIPWNPAFASCQNVCWTGVFTCTANGLSFNWQWGAACYANSKPAYTNICPKACHNVGCQNGQYYSSGDHAGCPENCKPYCVGGGTGGGGANCTGSWSSTDTTCTFTNGAALPPTLNGVPASDYLGINPTNIPTLSSVLALVTATDTCSPATVSGSVSTSSNGCNVTQVFTIVATNGCGYSTIAYVTNTWMTLSLTNCSTNTICTSFNSYNPANSWLWCNSHLTGKPGSKDCWVICTNASITLRCNSGKTYTFPVPNGQIHFSTNCTVGTNWFDGTNWNTVLPCGGDDEIFVQGCAIPWLSDFANCQSVCWNGVYCCTVPGLSFNWQFGAACFSNQQPSDYNSLCSKACHQTPCQNGQYYNQYDHAGTPENCNPYCVGGGTGGGGSNCTGNFSNPGTCNF